MSIRIVLAAALAASTGIMAIAPAADAAWKGLKAFDCETSRSNWNFDGLYGNFTTRAIRNFQRAKGLKVDGVAGPETIKALGLRYRRSLKCGAGGNDVFILQQALASAGFWYGGEGGVQPEPTAKPTPAWTEAPMLYTPAPYTPAPTMAPTMSPTMEPTPWASESPMDDEPTNTPTVELHGGDWMVPLNAGSTNYDYMFQRPTWVGGGTLWLGDFGLGGEATVFNTTYADYRPTGPYFMNGVTMYDALAKYRFDRGYFNVFAGYRGLGNGNVNFGQLGVAMDHPLIGKWLWLQAKAQGGHNFQTSYFAEGRAGLGLRVDPLTVELGFRHFAFQNQTDPLFNLNGPVAEVRLAF